MFYEFESIEGYNEKFQICYSTLTVRLNHNGLTFDMGAVYSDDAKLTEDVVINIDGGDQASFPMKDIKTVMEIFEKEISGHY